MVLHDFSEVQADLFGSRRTDAKEATTTESFMIEEGRKNSSGTNAFIDYHVYQPDEDEIEGEASHPSPVPIAIQRTVRDIDGVLNEMRLHSSPDPNDRMFPPHFKYGNSDDDAMSDASKVTTSNLLKELNQVNESFLYVVDRETDHFHDRGGIDDFDVDMPAVTSGVIRAPSVKSTSRRGFFVLPRNDLVSCEISEDVDTGRDIQARFSPNNSNTFHTRNLIFPGSFRGWEQISYRPREIMCSSSRRSRYVFAFIGAFLVTFGVIIFGTSDVRSKEEGSFKTKPISAVGALSKSTMPNQASLLTAFPSLPPSLIPDEISTPQVEALPQNSLGFHLPEIGSIPESLEFSVRHDTVKSEIFGEAMTATEGLVSSNKNNEIKSGSDIVTETSESGSKQKQPSSTRPVASSFTPLPVSGEEITKAKIDTAIGKQPTLPSSASLPISDVANNDANQKPSIDESSTTSTSSFARSPQTDHSNDVIKNEDPYQYIATNNKDPVSAKKAKNDKTYNDGSIEVRRVLLRSKGRKNFRKRTHC